MPSASRHLARSLSRTQSRSLSRYATRMQGGARRPRQPNGLRVACRLLNTYIRLTKRAAKRDPHVFGPRARVYFLDTLRMEQEQKEIEAAIRKVYGPPKPGTPPPVSTLWSDRYPVGSARHRLFLKWFHERYPAC